MLPINCMQACTSPDTGDDRPVFPPAVSILHSTEQVVSAMACALPENQNSFAISKLNLGIIGAYMYC